MSNEKLQAARKSYLKDEITFKELDAIFWEVASDSEKQAFNICPVYDKPNIVIGKSQAQMDREWNDLIR